MPVADGAHERACSLAPLRRRRSRAPRRRQSRAPRRRDGAAVCPSTGASPPVALTRPGAGKSASVVSRARSLALSASSRGVARASSFGLSLGPPSMLRMRADLGSAAAFAADKTVVRDSVEAPG
jgi:hypothetical protein